MQLTASQLDTLTHLARVVIAGAEPSPDGDRLLAERCASRISPLPSHKRAQVGQAIDLLGSRVGVAIAIGRPWRFGDLDAATQARCFAAWCDSSLPIVRAAAQTLRRIVLVTHYGHPVVAATVGAARPFRMHGPQYAWEGPLAGAAHGTGALHVIAEGTPPVMPREPVARGRLSLPTHISRPATPVNVHTKDSIEAPVHKTADVVVIGSGAGGAVAAATLAEAGFDVIVLEGGGWHTKADFTENDPELAERLLAEGGFRSTDDGSVGFVQGETAGGSTTVNWMIMLRTPDWVLEQWARESGVEGMSPREMAPVFERIEDIVHAATVPEEAHSANNRIILDGARALGWSAYGGRINAKGCIRCGYCTAGCRHDAKQSALITWLPRALAAGATIYTDALARRIELRERDTGRGTPPLKRVHADVRGAGGARHPLTIDAPIVISAGGAVGTPVLLQRSGLGGDAVGDFLRIHPVTACFGRYDRDIDASSGIPLTTVCDEHLRWDGTDYGFWIETPSLPPWLAAASIGSFGAAHAARMRDYRRTGALIGLTRDGAEVGRSSGRVRVNRRGEVSIRYRLTPQDTRRVRASIGAMAALHFAAGATEVSTAHGVPRVATTVAGIPGLMDAPMGPNQMALFTAHVNGTCRMGTDRRTSGATPDGERYGARGLYISDGSLLPTALGVNPQATIMAVASVLADRIVARHAGVPRS